MEVKMEINYSGGGATLNKTTLEAVKKLTEDQRIALASRITLVIQKTMFQVLIYALKICNVDTGRLRGGFTPFMVAKGFGGYQGFLSAPSEDGETSKTKKKGFSQGAVEEGAAESAYIEDQGQIIILNNVQYASYVDAKTGLIGRILARAEYLLNKNLQNFLEAVGKDGPMPPAPASDDSE